MTKLKLFGSKGPAAKTVVEIKGAQQLVKDIDGEIREKRAKRDELIGLESDLEIEYRLGDVEAQVRQKEIPDQIADLDKRLESLNRARSKAFEHLKAAEAEEYERTKKEKWRVTKKLTDSIMAKSSEWQSAAEKLASLGKEIQKLSIEAFNSAPRKDSDFVDCLLSPDRIQNQFKNYLFKVSGWYFCANSVKTQHQLPVFLEEMKEATGWIMKFDGSKDLRGQVEYSDTHSTGPSEAENHV